MTEMQKDAIQAYQNLLKKLRKKAELCRFCHSELKAAHSKRRNLKELSIVLLSLSSVAVINFYYREILTGNWVLVLAWILPLIITIVQALDHTVYRWTNKTARHESAVAIWGDWVREADFLEKRIDRYKSDLVAEKMQNIQAKYNCCMSNTEQIPNSKFLEYKKKFVEHVQRSKELDTMFLKDINTGNTETER